MTNSEKYVVVYKTKAEGEAAWYEHERTYEITINEPSQIGHYPDAKFVSAKLVKSVEREHIYIDGFQPFTEPISAEHEEQLEAFNVRDAEKNAAEIEAEKLGLITRELAEYCGD